MLCGGGTEPIATKYSICLSICVGVAGTEPIATLLQVRTNAPELIIMFNPCYVLEYGTYRNITPIAAKYFLRLLICVGDADTH